MLCTYLGNGEEVLGDINDAAEVLDAAHARLDGIGVVLAGGVQDVLELVGLAEGPLAVGGAGVVVDGPVDGQQGDGDDGLLVDDQQLVADGGDAQAGAGGEEGGLGHEVVAGQGVQDVVGRVLGLGGGLVLLEAGGGGGEGGGGRSEGARGEGWASSTGGAWRGVEG
ncbi:ATP synthase subunit 4 [Hortaea werneckii]|nr:ATP synthase subunit 4 [Hortaea werneckii]